MSIAASFRKNPLLGVQALGRALAERDRKAQEKQEKMDIRKNVAQFLQNQSVENIAAAPTDIMSNAVQKDMPQIGNAGNARENIFGKQTQFGGDAFGSYDMGDGIGDRLSRIRSAGDKKQLPRQYDVNDILKAVDMAGDDEGALGMVDIAQRVNSARKPKKEIREVDGGLYETEQSDDLPTRIRELRKPIPKNINPLDWMKHQLNIEELDVRKGELKRKAAEGGKEIASKKDDTRRQEALRFIENQNKIINTTSNKIAQLDTGGEKDAKGKQIKPSGDGSEDSLEYKLRKRRYQLDLFDATTKLIAKQKEMGWETEVPEWYKDLAAIIDGKSSDKKMANDTGDNQYERAKKVLTSQGYDTSDDNIKTFIANNPAF